MFEELGVIYQKLGEEERANAEAGDRVQSGLNGVHAYTIMEGKAQKLSPQRMLTATKRSRTTACRT